MNKSYESLTVARKHQEILKKQLQLYTPADMNTYQNLKNNDSSYNSPPKNKELRAANGLIIVGGYQEYLQD